MHDAQGTMKEEKSQPQHSSQIYKSTKNYQTKQYDGIYRISQLQNSFFALTWGHTLATEQF